MEISGNERIKIRGDKNCFPLLSELANFLLGCKVYIFNVTSDGNNPPLFDVFKNTIGNVVWERVGDGWIKGTLVGAFPANKTWTIINVGDINNSTTRSPIIYRSSDDVIEILYESDTMQDTSFRIEVYS